MDLKINAIFKATKYIPIVRNIVRCEEKLRRSDLFKTHRDIYTGYDCHCYIITFYEIEELKWLQKINVNEEYLVRFPS